MIICDFNKKDFLVNINHDLAPLSSEQESQIDGFWQTQTSENPELFDGDHFSVLGAVITNKTIKLDICKTSYKRSLWMRDQVHKKPGFVILGTGVYIYDDAFIYFVRRGNVATDRGKIATVAGCVDYDKNVTAESFFSHVEAVTYKELEEEASLAKNPDRKELKYLGLIQMEEDGIFRFRFAIKGTVTGVGNDENSEVIKVRLNELENFYTSKLDSLNKTERVCLKHYFIDGKIWQK